MPRDSKPARLVAGQGGGFKAIGRRGRSDDIDLRAVINCCHGVPGEDGTLQAVLDLAGVPYTGPSQWGAAIGMDKLAFAGLATANDIPHLPCELLDSDGDAPGFYPPYIVKPRFGGSSIGILPVEDHESAKAAAKTQPLLRDGAVIEPFRDDIVDLNISVRTWPQRTLSAIERPLRADGEDGIYSYADKYIAADGAGMDQAPRELPAELPVPVEAKLRTYADRVADLAMIRSVARIDFFWDGGDGLWVNEVNTIPGSLSHYFWTHEGIGLPDLLESLVAEAEAEPTRRFRTDGADGVALRHAGSIAKKLGG